ncbi:aspartyl protease family protein [Aliiglaciecola sp. CAU 1673]|uniref:aspartyl protease family protein n=1 Tax=Aliiglaciecola sp. CAU 1673 TaxID=3032595 RepID=UPI0023DA34B4|nr:aspartyl protease family protein [Aliiglaciecola sp. CAU 1673]MDF2178262.1 aspartyl protease family protein [Aliiglaciecola sp. CAU 1673]
MAALESRFIGEKPYIKIRVDDNTELLMLIDTGAAFTLLMDTPKVKALNLHRGYELEIGGWGDGENSKAYQTVVDSLTLGPATFRDVKLAQIPLLSSPYFLRADEAIFDGVLGYDLLRHFSWHFDKSASFVAISNQPYAPEHDDTAIAFERFMGKIRVPVEVQFSVQHSRMEEVLIDTGSRHYFKLSSAYPKSEDIPLPAIQVRGSDFGLSGETQHRRFRLPALTVASRHYQNISTHLIPGDDPDDWWVIGSALLNQSRYVIDYHSDKLYLGPAKNKAIRYNLTGVELRKILSGEFVVRAISPDSPAHDRDIRVGDLVISIDGRHTARISEDTWLDLASVAATRQLCFKRDEHCIDVEIKHIQGYSTDEPD